MFLTPLHPVSGRSWSWWACVWLRTFLLKRTKAGLAFLQSLEQVVISHPWLHQVRHLVFYIWSVILMDSVSALDVPPWHGGPGFVPGRMLGLWRMEPSSSFRPPCPSPTSNLSTQPLPAQEGTVHWLTLSTGICSDFASGTVLGPEDLKIVKTESWLLRSQWGRQKVDWANAGLMR